MWTSSACSRCNRIGRFFVIRAKSNTKYRRRYSHSGDKSSGVRCARTIALTSNTFNFLTNNFAIPAQAVADLYRYR